MSIERFRLLGVIFFVVLLVIGGCALMGKGTQQPTKSYILNSLYSEETQPQPVADLHDMGIMVGPIRMAMYLDRSDVVIRNSQNEVTPADFSQWAGPLQENFSRILAENLSILLSTDKVGIFPGTKAMFFDYIVQLNVTRFDGMPGDKAYLRARWSILNNKRKKILFQKHSVLSHPTENDSIEALVASQSLTVADLSREIAEAIKVLAEAKNPKN